MSNLKRKHEGEPAVRPGDAELLRLSSRRRVNDSSQSLSGEARKKVAGAQTSYDQIGGAQDDGGEFAKRHASSKHTLDSDEEDDNLQARQQDRLDLEEVDGQEEATVEFDDETKITPFNMQEELEEGYYDKEGNFVFNKDKNDIRDEWMDNIDWTTVKSDAGRVWRAKGDGDVEEQDEFEDTLPRVEKTAALYTKILEFMKPGETLTRTLKRLQPSQKSEAEKRRERWQAKKLAQKADGDGEKIDSTTKPGETDLVVLTGLIDKLVDAGQFEIYGATFEKLNFLLEKEKKTMARDELDIFAEDIDEKPTTTTSNKAEKDETSAGLAGEEEVMWEYKLKNDPEEQPNGPHSSAQMQKWAEEEDFFKEGVWVRRIGSSGNEFHSSKRIDFDLYT